MVIEELGIVSIWESENITIAWENWYHAHSETNRACLPLIISWEIWLARNTMIF